MCRSLRIDRRPNWAIDGVWACALLGHAGYCQTPTFKLLALLGITKRHISRIRLFV